jgi:hypothetical protein
MKRFGVGVASAMVIAASLSLVAMSGTAYAISSVSCKKLTGTVSGSVAITTCSPTNPQYVTLGAKTSTLASGAGTLVWKPSLKTTMLKTTFKTVSPSKCGLGTSEFSIVGSVTGGTATYTKKLDVVKAFVCDKIATGALSLLPNTVMTL